MVKITGSQEVNWDAIKRRIEGAVEAGEMTREEADAKYREINARMSRKGKEDGIDWATVKATPPEEWSEELKAQIVAAGYDVEALAERVRHHQAEQVEWDAIKRRIESAVEAGEMTREEADAKYREIKARMSRKGKEDGIDWRAAMATPPEEWSEELKAQITAAGYNLEEIAEKIRQRQHQRQQEASDLDAIGRRIRAAVERGELTPEEGRERMAAARRLQQEGHEENDDRLRAFRRGVVERAMATSPEEWSDELKAAIVRAGWDLEEFTEKIRQRQQLRSRRER
jgi:hypothetical protein